MSSPRPQFEYQVCYGVGDRVTLVNGAWIGGEDIPLSERKQEDCPLMWEFLNRAGAEGWELVTILGPRFFYRVSTYFLKRERDVLA